MSFAVGIDGKVSVSRISPAVSLLRKGSMKTLDCAMTALSDSDLVRAARFGQQAAYEELCKRYSKRIFATTLRITRNQEDAEDAVQDSLLKAFVALQRFEERSAFSTWLTSIAVNSALGVLRKRRRLCEASINCFDESGESMLEFVEERIGPEETAIEHEMAAHLEFAIGRLPLPLKCVMGLRQDADKSLEEIAAALGITVPATKSRLSRARAMVRNVLVPHQNCDKRSQSLISRRVLP